MNVRSEFETLLVFSSFPETGGKPWPRAVGNPAAGDHGPCTRSGGAVSRLGVFFDSFISWLNRGLRRENGSTPP